jgi:hypothetical protein
MLDALPMEPGQSSCRMLGRHSTDKKTEVESLICGLFKHVVLVTREKKFRTRMNDLKWVLKALWTTCNTGG